MAVRFRDSGPFYPQRLLAQIASFVVLLIFFCLSARPQISFSSEDANFELHRLKSKDPKMRAAAARMLGNIGRDTEFFGVVPFLADTLRDKDAEVREAAAFALGAIGAGKPSPLSSNALRKQTVDVAVPALIQALKNDGNDKVRETAAEALGSFGPNASPAVLPLAAALDSKSSDVRRGASNALSKLGADAQTAVPALITFLKNADSNKRYVAAGLLSQIGPGAQAAAPFLLPLLKDGDTWVRVEAAAALGSIGQHQAEALAVLVPFLKDENRDLRARAAGAIGQFGVSAQTAIPSLTRAFTISEDDVRPVVAYAISRIAKALRNARKPENVADLRRAAAELERASTPDIEKEVESVKEDVEFLEVYRRDSLKASAVALLRGHRWVLLLISAWALLVMICALLLWLSPLQILRYNTLLKALTIQLPGWLGGGKVSFSYFILIGFFEYQPRVLDAWVSKHVPSVRARFERLPTVEERSVYLEVPVTLDGKRITGLTSSELRPSFARRRNCVFIVGEGGAGKTSLACLIARAVMSEDPDRRVCDHLLLPVMIEDDLMTVEPGKDVLVETVRGQLRYLMEGEEPPSEELVLQLLKQRRILVIIDGLSEKNECTRRTIHPEHPRFALNALVLTSRVDEKLSGIDVTVIRPMRIQGNRLASFMDAYLSRREKRELFDDPEFFNACGNLSTIVADREITVLLAKMYAEQMITSKEPGMATQVPENIPDLMLNYLNELNRKVEEGRLADRIVNGTALKLAWACLRRSYRPSAVKVEELIDEFGVSITDHVEYLERRLRLIQTVGIARDQIRFSLDPLAEYLAALHLMERNGDNEQLWRQSFLDLNSVAYDSSLGGGFLLALHDCYQWKSSLFKVPSSVLTRLSPWLQKEALAERA